jgi:hypothetical protein
VSQPIIYYGNALLSGTLSGSNATAANPIARVRDGSVNNSFKVTLSGATDRDGVVGLTLTTAAQPTGFVLPRCALSSGATVTLIMQTGPTDSAGLETLVSDTLTEDKSFYLADIAPTSGNLYFALTVSATSGITVAQTAHEIVLAQKYTLPRSPEVSVSRGKLRQFNRTDIPGGEPFIRRTGPMLRETAMNFVIVSGSEANALRGFVGGVEGGSAFTLTDDLGDSYWSELVDADVPEEDEAGVSSVALTFREIGVDNE